MTARAHEFDRMIRELHESQKKTDEEIKFLARKTDREIENVNKLVAGISDGWGRLTESLAIASAGEAFRQVGLEIVETSPRVWRRRDGEEMELDLLATAKKGRKHITLVVESKSTLRVKDIDAVLDDMRKFFIFFPEYRRRELIGAICYMSADKGVRVYAERRGLYLLSWSGDVMVLKNSEGFRPRMWRAPSR